MHAFEADVLATPHFPHRFVPRKYGSPEACEICGAVRDDDIHIDRVQPDRRKLPKGRRASDG